MATDPAAPLRLEIALRAPRIYVGESAMLEIGHHVERTCEMETVDLNNDRTTIHISRLDPGEAATLAVSGADYAARHHVSMLQPFGTTFTVDAGSTWTSEVDLALYCAPLPVGRYQISLSYRLGDEPGTVLTTNEVELEVLPTEAGYITSRWLGGANPRESLAVAWTAETGSRCVFQTGRGAYPEAVASAADLEMTGTPSAPVIAAIDGIAEFQYHRWLTWLLPDGFGCARVHSRGVIGAPAAVAIPSPTLFADPPLQRGDGGLSAVVIGDSGTRAYLVTVQDESPANNPSVTATFELADSAGLAATAWLDDGASGFLYHVSERAEGPAEVVETSLTSGAQKTILSTEAKPLALLVDQWADRRQALLLARDENSFRVQSWTVPDGQPAERLVYTADEPVDNPVAVSTLGDGSDLVLMFRRGEGWQVVAPFGRAQLADTDLAGTRPPLLLVTRNGDVFAARHNPVSGFEVAPFRFEPDDADPRS